MSILSIITILYIMLNIILANIKETHNHINLNTKSTIYVKVSYVDFSLSILKSDLSYLL